MKLSSIVIEAIKQKTTLHFECSKDYSVLAEFIFKQTGRRIGSTTLKRLMGNIDDERNANEYTLNTLALFLGSNSWKEYNEKHELNSEWSYEDNSIYIYSLKQGSIFEITYLNRVITCKVVNYQNQKALQVLS